jgi:transposase
MLRRNDIVMMDNCRVHLGPGIRRAIEKAGATLRYLPKYSPDLIPSRCLTANSRHSCVK